MTPELAASIKAHKAELLTALAHPASGMLWWRVAITEPDGKVFEVDTPSGWTLAEWEAYARRY